MTIPIPEGYTSVEAALPEPGKLCCFQCYEFGCEPIYVYGHYWQSSQPGQRPQFYLDEQRYQLERPWLIGHQVRAWMYV